jgi:predicted RNA-binding Zn-ribbon protein involved in translation (DUF1610 family)
MIDSPTLCQNCGDGFTPRTRSQRFCCAVCNRANAARARAVRRQQPAGVQWCAECGGLFYTKIANQRFCDGACKLANNNRAKRFAVSLADAVMAGDLSAVNSVRSAMLADRLRATRVCRPTVVNIRMLGNRVPRGAAVVSLLSRWAPPAYVLVMRDQEACSAAYRSYLRTVLGAELHAAARAGGPVAIWSPGLTWAALVLSDLLRQERADHGLSA